MSGPELAESLKKLRPNTDVIYISGYTDDKLRDEYESGELMLRVCLFPCGGDR